jgi:hypothetical protein
MKTLWIHSKLPDLDKIISAVHSNVKYKVTDFTEKITVEEGEHEQGVGIMFCSGMVNDDEKKYCMENITQLSKKNISVDVISCNIGKINEWKKITELKNIKYSNEEVGHKKWNLNEGYSLTCYFTPEIDNWKHVLSTSEYNINGVLLPNDKVRLTWNYPNSSETSLYTDNYLRMDISTNVTSSFIDMSLNIFSLRRQGIGLNIYDVIKTNGTCRALTVDVNNVWSIDASFVLLKINSQTGVVDTSYSLTSINSSFGFSTPLCIYSHYVNDSSITHQDVSSLWIGTSGTNNGLWRFDKFGISLTRVYTGKNIVSITAIGAPTLTGALTYTILGLVQTTPLGIRYHPDSGNSDTFTLNDLSGGIQIVSNNVFDSQNDIAYISNRNNSTITQVTVSGDSSGATTVTDFPLPNVYDPSNALITPGLTGLGGYKGLAFGSYNGSTGNTDGVYVVNDLCNNIVYQDKDGTNTIIQMTSFGNTITRLPIRPSDIACDALYIYVFDICNNVTQIVQRTGEVNYSLSASAAAINKGPINIGSTGTTFAGRQRLIACDGTNIWVGNSLNNQISRLATNVLITDVSKALTTYNIDIKPNKTNRIDNKIIQNLSVTSVSDSSAVLHWQQNSKNTKPITQYQFTYNSNTQNFNTYDVSSVFETSFTPNTGSVNNFSIDSSFVWIADTTSSVIKKIDVSSNQLLSTIPYSNSYSLYSDGTFLWVSNTSNNVLSCINPISGNVVRTFTVGTHNSCAVASNGTVSYVADYNGSIPYLYISSFGGTYSSATGSTATYPLILSTTSFTIDKTLIEIDIRHIWVYYANSGSGSGIIYNKKADGVVLDTSLNIPNSLTITGLLNNMSSDNNYLWLSYSNTSKVTKYDISNNTTTDITSSTVTNFPVNPTQVKTDGVYLWVSDSTNGTLTQLDINSNTVIAVFNVTNANALVTNKNNVWVADNTTNSLISKFSTNNYRLTGLSIGTTYNTRLTSTTSLLSTQIGPVSFLTTGTAPIVPNPPTSLSTTGIQDVSATVHFTGPTNAGSAPITEYDISFSTFVDILYVAGDVSGGSPTSYTYDVSGLSTNTDYTYYVSAVNSAGTSTSNPSTTFLTLPSPPTSVSVGSITSSSAVVTFTPPTGTGTITGYTITNGVITATGSSSGITLSGLSSSTTYSNFTIKATNATGDSTTTPVPSFTTSSGGGGTVPCFAEGSQILCLNHYGEEVYIPVEKMKPGTLVKTLKNGYVAVDCIGTTILHSNAGSEREKNKIYRCSPSEYPELFEDLYITGCHSILTDSLSEEEHEGTVKMYGRIKITDEKYRLSACLDKRAEPVVEEGVYNIWHFALENEEYTHNYGVWANGLLVETTSLRYMRELSGMKLVEKT